MKKLLFLLALLPFVGSAQTVTVAAGSDGYVTINGQNYKRGDLRSVYTYRASDSLLAIIFSSDRTTLISPKVDTMYLYADSSNRKARSMPQLRTWMNTNFEFKH